MPHPRKWETYSHLAFNGDSKALHSRRIIWTPARVLDGPSLPDTRIPGAADRYYNRFGGTYGDLAFSTEFQGTTGPPGAPLGSLVIDNDLYCACGFWKDVSTGVGVCYALTDNFHNRTEGGATHPVDMELYNDGLYHYLADSVGDCTFHFPANDVATIEWAFNGTMDSSDITEAPQIGAHPAFDTTVGDPLTGVGATLTLTPAGGVAKQFVYRNLDIALNNEVPDRDDIAAVTGYTEHEIVDRNVQVNFVIEAPDFATYQWTPDIATHTVYALNLVLGATPGNIATVTVDFTVDRWVELTDADKILGYAIEGSMEPGGRLQICWT